ncbi:MAG TPA: sialidase family protein, partial [Chitinophagaceae bacterium]|nr:sialidase family protein [Chitinophagaceae bacterium]
MKIKVFVLVLTLIAGSAIAIWLIPGKGDQQKMVEERRKRKEKKAEAIEARARYDFDMIKDPATGKVPKGIFDLERAIAKSLPLKGRINNPAARGAGVTLLNNYLPAGPNNVGGRTRAVAYDVRFGAGNNVIISGCVSGGIMRSDNGGQTWTKVTPEEDTHSFTAIAQDTRTGSQNTWYAGGGEAYGNTASELGATYLGNGLWKSVDNGLTWTKLPLGNITEINGTPLGAGTLETFDHPFDYVHKIVVHPVNGDVYVAGHRRLVRSTNGGASFQTVFGSIVAATPGSGQMDVVISNTGRIFLGVNGGYPDAALRGVWISGTGAMGSFARIAGGQSIGIDSIPGWRGNDYTGDTKRILISLAPSDQNIGYVFYENGLKNESPALKPEADLFRFDVAGNNITWSNRSANMPDINTSNLSGSDPLAVQNGYNMLVAVKPNDPNTVFVGGTNLYRSTNGFSSNATTNWINGYNTNFTYQQYPNGHPDQHILVFNPSNVNQAIVGDDGGLRITSEISAALVTWNPLPNYQTLQYYYVSIDPETGRNNFIGGAQDNGTQLRDRTGLLNTALPDSNNHQRLVGGDGGAVGFSKFVTAENTQFLYGSSQQGDIRRLRLLPTFSNTDIKPNNLTANDEGGFGEFVTNFRLNPDNTEDLYYVNFNRLFRTTSASSVTPSTWTELTGISSAVNPANPGGGKNISIRAMEFSRGNYAPSHALF